MPAARSEGGTTFMQRGSSIFVQRRTLYGLVYLAMLLSLGHHIDHVIRGNSVGWPLTALVNAFTYSLGVYPLILLGLFLYRANRVGPGYWAILSGMGAVFVAWIHFGPATVEPPAEIINLYEPRIIGWLAFLWLVVFMMVLAVTFLYELRSVVRSAQRFEAQAREGVSRVPWISIRNRPPAAR